MIRFLEYTVTLVLLVILQEFVFDHINLSGLVNPYVYIMFIILLPLDMRPWMVLLLGFGSGAVMDVLSGTAGLHLMTATWLAFVRPAVAGVMIGKEEVYEGGVPSAGRLGAGTFIRYLFACVLLFAIPFFILEDLSGAVWAIALRTVLSTLVSTAVIYFLHLPLVRVQKSKL